MVLLYNQAPSPSSLYVSVFSPKRNVCSGGGGGSFMLGSEKGSEETAGNSAS